MRRKVIEGLILRLGITANYRGYEYLIEGIELAVTDAEKLLYITKEIYPELARRHHSTPGRVERNIRTVIEAVWKRGPELFQEVIGCPFSGKPSVSQLIGRIVGHLSAENDRPYIPFHGSSEKTAGMEKLFFYWLFALLFFAYNLT